MDLSHLKMPVIWPEAALYGQGGSHRASMSRNERETDKFSLAVFSDKTSKHLPTSELSVPWLSGEAKDVWFHVFRAWRKKQDPCSSWLRSTNSQAPHRQACVFILRALKVIGLVFGAVYHLSFRCTFLISKKCVSDFRNRSSGERPGTCWSHVRCAYLVYPFKFTKSVAARDFLCASFGLIQ